MHGATIRKLAVVQCSVPSHHASLGGVLLLKVFTKHARGSIEISYFELLRKTMGEGVRLWLGALSIVRAWVVFCLRLSSGRTVWEGMNAWVRGG